MQLYRSKDDPNKWALLDIGDGAAQAVLCRKPIEGGTYAPLRVIRLPSGDANSVGWDKWELSPSDEDVIANTLHHLLTRLVE